MSSAPLASYWITALLIILLFHASVVSGGWPSKLSKRDKATLEDIVSGRLQLPTELKLFVRYNTIKGIKKARRWSKNGKILSHYRKQKILTFQASNSTALKKLLKSSDIDYVEPVHQIKALPFYQSRQAIETAYNYGVKMVQASELWNMSPGEVLTICVIDSGYALGHPDLPGIENGVTGTSSQKGDWSEDPYGHGTHCAGTIGSLGNNDKGVVGVMKPSTFKFHIGKALDLKGVGSESDLAYAFESCVDAKANVISMSLGDSDYSETIQTMCKEAYDEGILLIAAAGNSGDSSYKYPASYPSVMSVSAVDNSMKVATFSQYNDQVEIAAPGVNILSTVTSNNGQEFTYDMWSGTSMAAPFIAGVAGLVWSHFPNCTNNQIRNVLVRTARDVGLVGCDENMGYGIVQAKDAYDLLDKEGCLAGYESPVPLSHGAKGGCSQDPNYVAPPTPAPSVFSCTEKVFELELTTDDWAEETRWELRNSKGEIVGSGSGYRSSQSYSEKLCLPQDKYNFTIFDDESDGICCTFGNGGYVVRYNRKIVKSGGLFGVQDTVKFGKAKATFKPKSFLPQPSPTLSPTSSPPPTEQKQGTLPDPNSLCQDDKSWIHTTAGGKVKKKGCKFVQANPSVRCGRSGVNKHGITSTGYDSCPLTCGSDCGAGTITLNPISTAPTLGSSSSPTSTPTPSLTTAKTVAPGPWPSSTPSASPTRWPTASPTRSPTSMPTLQPTFQPSKAPTPYPSAPPTRTHGLDKKPTANYVLRPISTGCSPGTEIKTAKECEALVNSGFFGAGVTFNPCCQHIDNEPYGCFFRVPDKDVIFNGKVDSPTGSKANRQLACKKPGLETHQSLPPSPIPTSRPTLVPSAAPTSNPTLVPTPSPSQQPLVPSVAPTPYHSKKVLITTPTKPHWAPQVGLGSSFFPDIGSNAQPTNKPPVRVRGLRQ